MHFSAKKDDPSPDITLGNDKFQLVPKYKYLGIEIHQNLDSGFQWAHVRSIIKPTTFLLKQLKSNGLEVKILISVFKSLVQSHLRYSSVVLDSCTQVEKKEMQIIQNRMLRIIGVKKSALDKYRIKSASEFIESECIGQVAKILSSTTHSLPNELRKNEKRTTSSFPFTIPRAKTEKFNQSAVLKTLRHLRDKYGSRRRT